MRAFLEHDALIYRSDEEFLAVAVPFLRQGVRNGEGTVVATTGRNHELLTGALGEAAADVLFVPSSDVYRSPVAAIAAYDGVLNRFRKQGRPSVRAIGEVAYGNSAAGHSAWLPYEAVAHTVFQQARLHVLCPYDARALPGRLITHARRTHPRVHAEGSRSSSPDFADPMDVIRAHPSRISFSLSSAPERIVEVAGADPGPARRAIAEVVERHLSRERADEAMVAVAETLANGLRHGHGAVAAAVWVLRDAVVCSVRNDGPPIADALAGYRPPSDPEHGGMGLWIARQLADETEIDRDDRGPIVKLAFFR